ncbi:MAG: hypothetical protein HDR32_03015 [Treponema sp.]|nr:hypothetical protein [Treponema sp.]MBD5446720.1 hypothetical protein [Treponema sp.]
MKKILTTILAGTLVAGAAFAVDAKITLNFRSRLNALAMSSVESGDTTKTTRDWMNWDNNRAYNGAGSDTFKFVLNGDRAGATFAVNLATATGTGLFTLNEYSAWMNFPVGPGTLTLRTGNWKDGYADGAYRVKKDVDAQNGEGVDFEKFKLGSIFKGSQQLLFVDDLAKPANHKAIAGFADYGFNVNDNVNLNILVGGVSSGDYVSLADHTNTAYEAAKNHFDVVKDGDTTVTWNSAFVSRAQVKVKDVLNAELIYKLSHAAGGPLYHTFGLYVMPQVLDALTLNIGGAAEVYGGKYNPGKNADGTDKDKGDYFDWGVDLRARYQATDALSITFFTNVSGTNFEGGRAINAGNAGYKGTYGYINPFQNTDKSNPFGFTAQKFKVAMWNNLSGRFKINDLLTATLNVGLVTPLSKVDGDDNSYSPEWRVTPAVQIYAASNASLWAGVAISGASWETSNGKVDNSAICVEIPVIFRVKM